MDVVGPLREASIVTTRTDEGALRQMLDDSFQARPVPYETLKAVVQELRELREEQDEMRRFLNPDPGEALYSKLKRVLWDTPWAELKKR